MTKIEKALSAAVLSCLLSACGYNISPYSASATNVEAIRKAGIKPVTVEKFSSTKPLRNSITCRAAGPVETPDQIPFESYIEKAFIDELKLAGVYSGSSPVVIRGRVEELDFQSSMSSGEWLIRLNVSARDKPGFAVESKFAFDSAFSADKACQRVAQAFQPAVQRLIGQIVNDPRFAALAR